MDEDAALSAFIQDLQAQKRSRHTMKNYALTIHAFGRWLSDQDGRPAIQATPEDLKRYQMHLVGRRGLSKNTLYITVKALQAFYRFHGLDSADDLKAPRRSQSLPSYLTEQEAARLRAVVEADPRASAIVAVLLYSGVRVGELVRLRLHDLDVDEQSLRVRSGKGDKDRLVVLAPQAVEVLAVWIRRRPDSRTDYIFPGKGGRNHLSPITVQRLVAKAALDAGIDKTVTPHVLRHTLATTLLRRGGDIRFIQRILGHASIATTQVYTHLDDRELRRMYELAQPAY